MTRVLGLMSRAAGRPRATGGGGSGPPPSEDYPGLPSGLTLLKRWRNQDTLATADWYPDGTTPREQDPTDVGPGIGNGYRSRVTSGYTGLPPLGGAAVILGHFDAGVAGGSGQGRMTYDAPGLTEFAVCVTHQFPVGYPHSDNSNKLWFALWNGLGRCYVSCRMRADLAENGLYRVNFDGGMTAPGGGSVVDSTLPVVEGAWQRIVFYQKHGLAGTGIVQLFVDGNLGLDLQNVTFPATTCTSIYDEGENNGNYTQESPTARVIGYSPTRTGGSSGAPAFDAHNAAANRYTADISVYHRAA